MNGIRVIVRILSLSAKTGVTGLRYLLYRKRGVSAFEKELRRMGIDQDAVKQLSESYKAYGDVRSLVGYVKGRRA